MNDDYCKYIYYGAAQSGNLSLFQLMKKEGYPFNRKACKIAAENGHLNIIEWIMSEILVWKGDNDENSYYEEWIEEAIGGTAASKGHLHILKAIPSDYYSYFIIGEALQHSQMEVIKWLDEGDHIRDSQNILEYAAISGNVDIVKWAQKNFDVTFQLNKALRKAVVYGNLDVVKYLKDQDLYDWNSEVCSIAASYGCFEILKWAYENGTPLDETAASDAARSGNLNILKWLFEKECPISSNLAGSAIYGGNLELIKWLHFNKIFHKIAASYCAIVLKQKNIDLLNWLLDNNLCEVNKECVIVAIRSGFDLKTIQRLLSLGQSIDLLDVCIVIGNKGREDVMEWLAEENHDTSYELWKSAYCGAVEENQFSFMKKAWSKWSFCAETLQVKLCTPPLYDWLEKQGCL